MQKYRGDGVFTRFKIKVNDRGLLLCQKNEKVDEVYLPNRGRVENIEENMQMDLKAELEVKTPEDFLYYMQVIIEGCKKNKEDVSEKEEILQLAKDALGKINTLKEYGVRKEDREFEKRLKRE